LQKLIEIDFKGKLSNDFKVFVWTDDEWYHDPKIEAPDFEDYFYLLEEEDEEIEVEDVKENMLNWVKSFCSTQKLRDYLSNLLNDKYKGKTLDMIAKEWK
jgi:hypothetical protein